MSNRRTRNRQLARVAERRYAERRRRQRQRTRIIAGALAVGLIGLLVAVFAFRPKGQTSASATPSASMGPGSQTGTVPAPELPKNVACGGTVPTAASKPKPQFLAPPMTIDPSKSYTATIKTSCGAIVVDLLADTAPQTVNSFVFLADHGFFDGTQIHRIDTGIGIIQGGDPTAAGSGGPGYSIPDELTGKQTYGPGVVAMANAGKDTGGSQFFIVFDDNGHRLDANPAFTIFGTVVKGLDVVRTIGALPIVDPSTAASGDLSGQKPRDGVFLDEVTISTSG
jgi:cyclophilin family peptidyl-prolyl cis-trans isomerase